MKNMTCASHETWLTSSAVPTSHWAANSSSRWENQQDSFIPQDLTRTCSLCRKSMREHSRCPLMLFLSWSICRCWSETVGRGLKKSPGCWMGMNLLLQVWLPGHINEILNEAVEFSEHLHALPRGSVGFVQLSWFLKHHVNDKPSFGD